MKEFKRIIALNLALILLLSLIPVGAAAGASDPLLQAGADGPLVRAQEEIFNPEDAFPLQLNQEEVYYNDDSDQPFIYSFTPEEPGEYTFQLTMDIPATSGDLLLYNDRQECLKDVLDWDTNSSGGILKATERLLAGKPYYFIHTPHVNVSHDVGYHLIVRKQGEWPAEGWCGTGKNYAGINWKLDTETGIVNITGKGEMHASPDWNGYGSQIRKAVIGEGVFLGGSDDFRSCKNNFEGIEVPTAEELIMSQEITYEKESTQDGVLAYKFTPENDGDYTLCLKSPARTKCGRPGVYSAETGKNISDGPQTGILDSNHFNAVFSLTGGKTYYIFYTPVDPGSYRLGVWKKGEEPQIDLFEDAVPLQLNQEEIYHEDESSQPFVYSFTPEESGYYTFRLAMDIPADSGRLQLYNDIGECLKDSENDEPGEEDKDKDWKPNAEGGSVFKTTEILLAGRPGYFVYTPSENNSHGTGFHLIVRKQNEWPAKDWCGTGENYAGVTWELDTETGVLNITGKGEMYPHPDWNGYDDQVKKAIIGEGVSPSGSDDFQSCNKNFEGIEVPSAAALTAGQEAACQKESSEKEPCIRAYKFTPETDGEYTLCLNSPAHTKCGRIIVCSAETGKCVPVEAQTGNSYNRHNAVFSLTGGKTYYIFHTMWDPAAYQLGIWKKGEEPQADIFEDAIPLQLNREELYYNDDSSQPFIYSFTPEKEGNYTFRLTMDIPDGGGSGSLQLYNDRGECLKDTEKWEKAGENGISKTTQALLAGSTYYFVHTPLASVSPETGYHLVVSQRNHWPAKDWCGIGKNYAGINWVLDTETGVMNITGKGIMYPDPDWNDYESQIKKVIIEEGIALSGSHDFDCCALEGIEIPSAEELTLGWETSYQKESPKEEPGVWVYKFTPETTETYIIRLSSQPHTKCGIPRVYAAETGKNVTITGGQTEISGNRYSGEICLGGGTTYYIFHVPCDPAAYKLVVLKEGEEPHRVVFDPEDAVPVQLNQEKIFYKNDSNLYSFTPEESGKYTFRLASDLPNQCGDLELYDSEQNCIKKDKDWIPGNNYETLKKTTVELTAGEPYYVMHNITSYNVPANTGYHLVVRKTDEWPAEDWCGVGDNYAGVNWKFDKATGELHITGKGEMCEYPDWNDYVDQIQKIFIEKGVILKHIYCFNNFSNLTDLYFDGDVEDWAGSSCRNLYFGRTPQVHLQKAEDSGVCGSNGIALVWSFSGNTLKIAGNGHMQDWNDTEAPWAGHAEKITRIDVLDSEDPAAVPDIGAGAFRNLTALEEVILPDSVKEIRKDAFADCAALKDIYFCGTRELWDQISGEGKPNADGEMPAVHFICTEDLRYKVVLGKEPTCTEPGTILYYQGSNGKNYIELHGYKFEITEDKIPIPALGHDWGETTYEWNEDHTACTAERVCKNDPSHVETDEAEVTNEIEPATCTEKGKTTYTAVFTAEWAETQTVTLENIDALGHDWGETTYEWSEDYTTCTAKRVCKNDPSHVDTAPGAVTGGQTKAPTCTEEGQAVYNAKFETDWTENQEITVVIEALGHDWDKTTYEWNEDHTACTAKRVCKNDPSHVETDEAKVTNEVKPATCTEKGETTYTAVFTADWAETRTVTLKNIDALGHDWGETTYEWNEDHTTCTAKRVCKNDPSHVETDEAKVTEVVKPATCTEKGMTTYTAVFTADWAENQTVEEEIEALGHDWGEPTYEWNEDHTACTAKRVCKNDPSHVETDEAKVTNKVKPATCTKIGTITYTAVFTAEWTETQTVILKNMDALGHDWDTTTYVWSGDHSACTAKRVCKNDPSHVETATADVSRGLIKAPTCTEKGQAVYLARFDVDWAVKQIFKEEVEALGHDWGKTTYEWNKDHTACTAKRVCKNDSSHVETARAKVTSQVTPATCTGKGQTIYTAKFDADWAVDQKVTVEIEALGHAWGETTYEWNEDHTACTAKRVCKNDPSHVETAEAEVTSEQTKAPEIGVPGEMTYTAKFTADWAETQTETTEIPALIPETDASDKFTDVPKDAWYIKEVTFAVNRGLFGGTGENTFEPDAPMTRAMLVTVLWRYAEKPQAEESTFTDVDRSPDSWYKDAVDWAAANEIVGGVGDNKFDPNGNVTREQMAAILFRYAGKKGYDTSKRGDVSGFPDESEISKDWALEPLCWAVGEKLIGGSDGKLLPQGNATRAQVSAIFMRFIQNIAEKQPA